MLNSDNTIKFTPKADTPDTKRTPAIPGESFSQVMGKNRRDQDQSGEDRKQKITDEKFQDKLADKGEKAKVKKTEEKTNLSLFELAAEEAAPEEDEIAALDVDVEEEPLTELPEKIKELPLSEIFGHLRKELKPTINPNLIGDADSFENEPTTTKTNEKTQPTSQFAREQLDLASVNPGIQQQTSSFASSTNTPIEATNQVSRAQEIQEIIDQIVDKIYTIRVDGQTDTVITLKTPLFAGVNVILSSYDVAKKEFNIAFTNLTQNARSIILSNQESLKLGLEEKGLTVHIITASTYTEPATLKTSDAQNQGQGGRERGNKEDSAEDQRDRRRQQNEDEF